LRQLCGRHMRSTLQTAPLSKSSAAAEHHARRGSCAGRP
jgi:hypothetical protein